MCVCQAACGAGEMATPEMVVLCWDVLRAALESPAGGGGGGGKFVAPLDPPWLTCGGAGKGAATPPPRRPLFVTWKIWDGAREVWTLRGCIGNLSPLPLSSLKEYAIASSLRDRRFSPVTLEELPRMSCGVSLLTNYEDGHDWSDWTPGTHGIIIKFAVGGQNFTATYLPEVATEQNWDVPTAVRSLVRKAGYKGAVDDALLGSICLTRYQSSKAFLTWGQYQQVVAGRV